MQPFEKSFVGLFCSLPYFCVLFEQGVNFTVHQDNIQGLNCELKYSQQIHSQSLNKYCHIQFKFVLKDICAFGGMI